MWMVCECVLHCFVFVWFVVLACVFVMCALIIAFFHSLMFCCYY